MEEKNPRACKVLHIVIYKNSKPTNLTFKKFGGKTNLGIT